MRTRALLLALLAGGLSVAATIAVSPAVLDAGTTPSAVSVAARPDVADAPGPGAVARARDPFASGRDSRRLDAVVLAVALVVAAGAARWIARNRRAPRVPVLHPLTARPRAPPRSPALVCT